MLVLLSESTGQCETVRNMIRKRESVSILKIHPCTEASLYMTARSHIHSQESCPSDQGKLHTR